MTDLNRRDFIKKCVIGGVAVYSAPLLLSGQNAYASTIKENLKSKWKEEVGNNQPAFRFDAIEKVTGNKIYGRDYRAKDIPNWPDIQHYGFILRVNKADKIYEGFDLSGLSDEIKPYKVITEQDLANSGLKLPPYFGENMLLKKGSTPDYLGHEVAILLFDSFRKFKLAKNFIQFNNDIIQYGKTTELVTANVDPYASWRIVREENSLGSQAEDKYSTLKNGLFFPNYVDHKPVWPSNADKSGNTGEKGIFYANKLAEDIEHQDWLVIDRHFQTQSVDPMPLEPEAFNGWYDKFNESLHVVICSQSPQDFYHQAGEVLANSPLTKNIKKLIVHTPYIGGGFGGKDHTIFPYYGMMASLFATQPVHIANDRFEQFQSGIKRHPYKIHNKLAFDKNTYKIKGLISNMTLDGGGRMNFSPSVTMVGASAIQSIYYLPRNDIQAWCYPSQSPHAGSMRGYGTLQTMPTMEMMISEAAEALQVDPLQLRRINAFQAGQKNTQGAIPNADARYVEMLNEAEQHDIWKNRAENKKKFEKENPKKRYGVGFGIATKDYGTGADAPSTSIEITVEGKIIISTCSVEMGTGTDTSQGVLIAKHLGKMADNVEMAQIQLFDAMELIETDDPYLMSQETQDTMSKNPRWTPVIASASSASKSSYYQSHVTEAAAKILFTESLFPAAVAIWKEKYFNSAFATPDFTNVNDAHWENGHLSVMGNKPLSFELLAQKAHSMGLITSVMAHGFNRWSWAKGTYQLGAENKDYFLDGVAVKFGIGANRTVKKQANKYGYHVLKRLSVSYPKVQLNNAMVTYYTPCATLAEIAISEGSGKVEVLRTHTWLEPGNVHVKKLVEGQLEGGLTMGIGHTLYEYLPVDETGAGNGTWNLNRYQVPLAKHNGVWNMTHTLLPPLSPSDPTKGIAEVVMIPIVSALVEAIYQATNKRFYHLPISSKDIKEAI
ncbi:oxidoreductase [Psychromonas marina]|uniref:Oxidoreductase n=1 Tax=Psychromonas marina TaxID=88364 RepID=A0ABQ6E3J0_9GAMM|nr:molybdopterin cofactor-binding domain-containing protein [Psychromonas marina]GLS91917.1 oxidoreductase [Psychromonas marina]